MKIKVEACWHGGERYSFRLHVPNLGFHQPHQYISAPDGHWTREVASAALTVLETAGVRRQNVRFRHV